MDLSGKNVEIRYHNSGSRAVQAVEFTLIKPASVSDAPEVVAHYSTRGTVNVKQETTAVFHGPAGSSDLRGAVLSKSLEVQVTRVVFTDQSTWRPGRENTCKVAFSAR
jgi:hypothetical protein